VTDAMPGDTSDDAYGPDFLDRFKSKRQPTTPAPTASDKGKAGSAPTRLPELSAETDSLSGETDSSSAKPDTGSPS
jgi:hypothetical protein